MWEYTTYCVFQFTAIVEFRKKNVKPVTLSATLAAWIELVHRHNLSFTSHKCNTFILMYPKNKRRQLPPFAYAPASNHHDKNNN